MIATHLFVITLQIQYIVVKKISFILVSIKSCTSTSRFTIVNWILSHHLNHRGCLQNGLSSLYALDNLQDLVGLDILQQILKTLFSKKARAFAK